jgi:plasmid stabilization system protein ParE
MKPRFVLSPEALEDLASIWDYMGAQSSVEIADRVESVIRDRILFLARNPQAGHQRKDLTDLPVRFFPVYSYLIVYRPETEPLQVVAVLHGRREVGKVLGKRPS